MLNHDETPPAGNDGRRLDRNYEELELLNDKVRSLMLRGVPGAADLYRRNKDLLKHCERSRLQKSERHVEVGALAGQALIESQELLDQAAARGGAE